MKTNYFQFLVWTIELFIANAHKRSQYFQGVSLSFNQLGKKGDEPHEGFLNFILRDETTGFERQPINKDPLQYFSFHASVRVPWSETPFKLRVEMVSDGMIIEGVLKDAGGAARYECNQKLNLPADMMQVEIIADSIIEQVYKFGNTYQQIRP